MLSDVLDHQNLIILKMEIIFSNQFLKSPNNFIGIRSAKSLMQMCAVGLSYTDTAYLTLSTLF